MTMPRPSLVTSIGPSPVRGFIAAIPVTPYSLVPPLGQSSDVGLQYPTTGPGRSAAGEDVR